MKLAEKQELVRLLHIYMADLVAMNAENMKEAKKHAKKWEGSYYNGIKTQYEHARVIANRLSVQVGKELKTYWEL